MVKVKDLFYENELQLCFTTTPKSKLKTYKKLLNKEAGVRKPMEVKRR